MLEKEELVQRLEEIAEARKYCGFWYYGNGPVEASTAAFKLIRALEKDAVLDYRTIVALSDSLSGQPRLSSEMFDQLSDPRFYTLDNSVALLKKNPAYQVFLPGHLFSNSVFLTRTGITEIPEKFEAGNEGLSAFHIVPQIEKIGRKAFAGCRKMLVCDYIDRNNSKFSEVGRNAFEGCAELVYVLLPSSTAMIGRCAYEGCTKIDHISRDIPGGGKEDFYFVKPESSEPDPVNEANAE